ncbi:acyl carrier protein [Alloalcanivorax mobilis]|uniref:acyl carrier protein n=1 Tax=Alloalcanivorax mobilis TaxID=2019569 RepID=UPI000C76E4EA|nr:acyl carrier protein [Alloalcanivorax mobilis]
MQREEAIKIVIEVLEDNVQDLEMSDDKMDETLVDIGVDSLDVMLVMMDIQEKSGVKISDDKADELDTPNKIVDFILGN